ncbi:6-phosphofructo-2-kinase/fructose-2,6-bisphosphatase 3 [Smittium culicis]|uniref:6-phosphofructo-2-kinase/fructose-2, 6-bisphosphatase 3 n=1 Tax=Smittium culicis TaxID=133412 RepID=A0A1R1Y8N6_9FUNG|nr:6-phosphofructo-2-kinase/fructose-2,6-bisphosphatase 3 [Smittium culicis]
MEDCKTSSYLPIAIINVGLPARGKTHSTLALKRYFTWLGMDSKIFNVGEYRRKLFGIVGPLDSMFDNNNEQSKKNRLEVSKLCFKDLVNYLKNENGDVAIFDGSNLSKSIRKVLHDTLTQNGIESLFIEYICDIESLVEENIRKVKINSPDYIKMPKEDAVKDFKKKIDTMLPSYETIDEPNLSFIKLINSGQRIETNNLRGYLPDFDDHNDKGDGIRKLNVDGIIEYSKKLHSAVMRRINEINPQNDNTTNTKLIVWTSPSQSSVQAATAFENEINVLLRKRMMLKQRNQGIFNGLNPDEIKSKNPEEYLKYLENPYYHRYPMAESYYDLSTRLEAIILDLERETSNVLIIAPSSVLRCLYAYFAPVSFSHSVIPSLSFSTSNVIELTPGAYGCAEKKIPLV